MKYILIPILLLMSSVLLAEDLVVQRIETNDNRVLIGKYDKAKEKFDLFDEKSGKSIAVIGLKASDIKSITEVQLVIKADDAGDKRGINGKWVTGYDAAVKLAVETKRPILVLFTGSDWCPWCIKLDKEMLSNQQFKDWAKDNVVLLYLDFPQNKKLSASQVKTNNDLKTKYGCDGFPSMYLINEKGEKYDWTLGYSKDGFDVWMKYLTSSVAKFKK